MNKVQYTSRYKKQTEKEDRKTNKGRLGRSQKEKCNKKALYLDRVVKGSFSRI